MKHKIQRYAERIRASIRLDPEAKLYKDNIAYGQAPSYWAQPDERGEPEECWAINGQAHAVTPTGQRLSQYAHAVVPTGQRPPQ